MHIGGSGYRRPSTRPVHPVAGGQPSLQEEYKCIAQQWVKKKQGFILVYSIIDEVSFANLKAFFDLIQEEYLSNDDGETDGKIPPIVLVGNKCDLDKQRKVTTAQGQALATQWGAKFFETRHVALYMHSNTRTELRLFHLRFVVSTCLQR